MFFIFFLLAGSFFMTPVGSLSTGTNVDSALVCKNVESSDVIDIMLMMDHDYGANYHFIRPIFESWGWNVTVVGTAEVLSPCSYQSPATTLETDALISDIADVTQFDVISIMPGDSHTLLLSDTHALDLIRTAVAEGIVVGAWCKAVRVLAAAEVIDGLNVTGNTEFISDYEAAGATYLGIVPPVIQDNIVTGVRSRFYRQEICMAHAIAAGVYEIDAPTVSSASPDTQTVTEGEVTLLTANFTDATGVQEAELRIFAIDSVSGERNSTSPLLQIDMINGMGSSYSANVTGLNAGTFTVDVYAEDVFGNNKTYSDVFAIEVVTPSFIDPMILGIAGLGIGIVVVLIVIRFKKS